MRRLWYRVNRWLAWFHRWAGVVLCLLFSMWFASGAVLHFVGFPALPAEARRAAGEPVDMSRVRVTPDAALRLVPHALDLRLISVAGRPVYVPTASGGALSRIAADTGEPLDEVTAAEARTVAERFARAPAAAVTGPLYYDQWVVHQHFDAYRPFYRVRLDDPRHTDVYVSVRSGEVVQRTRGGERAWNWVGAVLHWIYFTPLRSSWSAWNQVVWWVSLVALSSAAAGTWLGLVRWAGNRAAGRRGVSPFRGWLRWHHVIGLAASVVVLGWILSGWLSMDHGRLFSRGEASAAQVSGMRGMELPAVAAAAGGGWPALLGAAGPVSEIDFNAVAGHPFLTAYGADAGAGTGTGAEAGAAADAHPGTHAPRILLLDDPAAELVAALPAGWLLAGVNRAWGGGARPVAPTGTDALYRRAESTGDAAVAFVAGAAGSTRVYVDPGSARLLAVMDASRRDYAWIYYALHTLQFPGLAEHALLRTVLVLTLLGLGFVFSLTGVVLSVVRLRRDLA